MKALALWAVLAASAASAQGARFAVHPLELREMTAAQREVIQAQFDVMLARVSDISLAGSGAVEEALLDPGGQGCETRDECLRFFAQATGSVYAVFARVRPDPLGAQLLVQARVVRSDGALMRKEDLEAPLDAGGDLTGTARALLGRLLENLELGTLSATVPVEPAAPSIILTRIEGPVVATASVRRPAGFALLGAGATALVGGAVVALVAENGRAKLSIDTRGAVPQSQASRALAVAREGQVATVLIPAGVVAAVLGGALAFWPEGQPLAVSMLAGATGAGLSVEGRFP